jgi:peptidoglycan/xylan/chitin deacetylase (PgdA/CDA1 family)
VIPLLQASAGWGGRLRIMMFHGVGVPEYPAQNFVRQIEQLAGRYEIVGIDVALQALHSDRPPARPQMVLTFDDGLRNNHRVAYPLLARLRLPAVFYVCPALIEAGCWLWNHEARERLRSMSPQAQALLVRAMQAAASNVDGIVEWMKRLPADACREVQERIRGETKGFEPSAAQRERFDMMSWDELVDLDPTIVTIGSHTLNHPILTSLPQAQLWHEVRASRQYLEDRLGRTVAHFCYPNGANDPAVQSVVAETYDTAVTTQRGYVRKGDDRHMLRRIAATPEAAKMLWRLHRRYPST